MKFRATLLGFTLLALLLAARPGGAQDAEVYKNVSSQRLEKILDGLEIRYKKTPGPKDGIHYYDFTRNNYKIRLHNYNGQDLWIDCLFKDRVALEDVNRWNVRAKFSRAVQVKDGDKVSVSLENQIDCLGGTTDAFIRQFILRFDGEIRDFVNFVSR